MWPRTLGHLTPSPRITPKLNDARLKLSPLFVQLRSQLKHASTTSKSFNQWSSARFLPNFSRFMPFKKNLPPIRLYRKRSFVLQEGFYRKRRKQPCRKKTWDFQRISSSKQGRIGETSLCMICWCKMVNLTQH